MNIPLGLVLGLTLIATDERPKLTVAFCNQAEVDTQIWVKAKAQTIRIFSQAGVDLSWVDVDPGNRTCILTGIRRQFLVVLSAEAPSDWTKPDAMGIAPARTGRAYVFYNLVQRFMGSFRQAQDERSEAGMVLAYAFAHEIGHLLIPGDAHGRGVMRPSWSYQEWIQMLAGTLWFNAPHAKVIRARLRPK